jgi:transcriptional regulator with XRE-family HTH domain
MAENTPLMRQKPVESQNSLGRRVREMRKARGWKLAYLSERTGLAISTISKMERGRYR